jgi:hypothetical protein
MVVFFLTIFCAWTCLVPKIFIVFFFSHLSWMDLMCGRKAWSCLASNMDDWGVELVRFLKVRWRFDLFSCWLGNIICHSIR